MSKMIAAINMNTSPTVFQQTYFHGTKADLKLGDHFPHSYIGCRHLGDRTCNWRRKGAHLFGRAN